MKCLQLFRVLNMNSGVSFNRAIQTGAVVLARTRKRKLTSEINYEPGIRYREDALSENCNTLGKFEDEEDSELDIDPMAIEKAYDLDQIDEKSHREKIGNIITIKKFFKSPPLPLTLTCNERDCIRYLHKADPEQWNVKALSESFPATPEAIKKVLRGRFKPDEEKKKKIDLKVQKTWELLAKDKLQAPPEVLEHLKRFINKREILLEQIKNKNFYLPEVKEEVVWNHGEMSNILAQYEKDVKKLIQKQEQQRSKMVNEGSQKTNSKVEKSSLSILHEKIEEHKSSKDLRRKESFMLSGMIKTYTKPVTLENLKKNLLLKASNHKELPLIEKAIVETVLGANSKPDCNDMIECKTSSLKEDTKVGQDILQNRHEAEPAFDVKINRRKMLADRKKLEKLMLNEQKKELVLPDSRTKFVSSNELGKLLSELNSEGDARSDTEAIQKEKSYISNTERLKKEDEYFAKEVQDLEDTSFWNNNRTSEEKALTERQKQPIAGPDNIARGKIYSSDVYPERINIPKDKRGTGLTFRVKDCYYDDDGEFLFRVPGMVK